MDFNALLDTLHPPRNCASGTTSVESKYTLLEEIGRGSYGVVWRARGRHGPQLYAIKQVSKRRAGAKGLQEVMGEVETMSLLSHPNIVRLEETFQDADCLWIVMEYLSGGTLQEAVRKEPMAETAIRRVITQLLMAIEYIHDKGIVHRDLKPANCLLAASGDTIAKISDFGFAVLAGTDQCLSAYCGTVAFMAPEILDEQNYGKPVDMWALGVIAFYLFTGGYPFLGNSAEALQREIRRGRCDLRCGRLALYPLLGDFLAKLLTYDSHQRMTAKDALKHPWIRAGLEDTADASTHYLTSPNTGTLQPSALENSSAGSRGTARRKLPAKPKWRAAVIAVMAAQRLLYVRRCSHLAKIGCAQLRLLHDYHYSVTGRFDPPSRTLECSRVFARHPQGLAELFAMVLSFPTAESLDLSHNGIDSLSIVQDLVKMCSRHPGLRTVNLSYNPIPAVAGRGLARLVRNPASRIVFIDLSGTLVADDVIAQINAHLKEKGSSSPLCLPQAPAPQTGTGTPSSFALPSAFVSSSSAPRASIPPARRKQLPLSDLAGVGGSVGGCGTTSVSSTERRRAAHASRLPPLPQAATGRRSGK